MTSRSAQATTVFSSALVQGLVSVAFPASAAVLRRHGLTDTQYGSIFLPQMALAAAGALGAGFVLHRIGAKRALALGCAFMALSQAALASVSSAPRGWAYPLALLGTSLLGLGAGVSAGPLNAYPQVLFPARSESAVVALHSVIGVGLALTPVLVGAALDRGVWLALPLILAAASLAIAVAVERLHLPETAPPRGVGRPGPAGVLALGLFAGVALLYGTTEAVYGNWAVVYLTEERGLGVAAAGLALTAFWAALTAGRLAVTAALLRVRPRPVLPALAGLTAATCLFVPLAESPRGALLAFAAGGLGCSAVFPLTVGLAGRRFPEDRTRVSSVLFAALVAGQAVGSLGTGLLHARLALATVYQLAAVPPALAVLLAGRAAREAGARARTAS